MHPPSELLIAGTAATLAGIGCCALAFEAQLRPPRWATRAFALVLVLASVATYYELFGVRPLLSAGSM